MYSNRYSGRTSYDSWGPFLRLRAPYSSFPHSASNPEDRNTKSPKSQISDISSPVSPKYAIIILFLLVTPPSFRFRCPIFSIPFPIHQQPLFSFTFLLPIFPLTLALEIPSNITAHTHFPYSARHSLQKSDERQPISISSH